jgi:hypothetical protein
MGVDGGEVEPSGIEEDPVFIVRKRYIQAPCVWRF